MCQLYIMSLHLFLLLLGVTARSGMPGNTQKEPGQQPRNTPSVSDNVRSPEAASVPESWSDLHIISAKKDAAATKMAHGLDAVIEPLRDRDVAIYYAKPRGSSTAVKVEFKKRLGAERRVQTAHMVSAETLGPHLQEPFCQFLADLWAKSVGLAVSAQLQGVRLDLAAEANPAYLEYLLRSYRTFGG